MYRIVTKTALKPTVILYEIEAPMVAKKAQPGQFIILRVDENGERAAALQESGDNSVRTYVREKLTEANALSGALQARRDTLTALLAALADLQGDYFRSGTPRRSSSRQERRSIPRGGRTAFRRR